MTYHADRDFMRLRVYVPEENDFFVYDVITIGSREIIRKKDCLEMILNHFQTASFSQFPYII